MPLGYFNAVDSTWKTLYIGSSTYVRTNYLVILPIPTAPYKLVQTMPNKCANGFLFQIKHQNFVRSLLPGDWKIPAKILWYFPPQVRSMCLRVNIGERERVGLAIGRMFVCSLLCSGMWPSTGRILADEREWEREREGEMREVGNPPWTWTWRAHRMWSNFGKSKTFLTRRRQKNKEDRWAEKDDQCDE